MTTSLVAVMVTYNRLSQLKVGLEALSRQDCEAIVVVDNCSTDGTREWLLEEARHQERLDVVLAPRLVRLRRLVIGEVPRFPELARAVFDQGPHRAVTTLGGLLTELDARGWLHVPDPAAAAQQLNWLVMGAPTNEAMFLGDDAVPTPTERQDHVRRAVSMFLSAYGHQH